MLNHVGLNKMITEKDRPILMYLKDIQCHLHLEGFGFDLTFHFDKNDYFSNEVLKKTYVMAKQNVIEKCQGTEIDWYEGRNITIKKVKKKQNNIMKKIMT